MLEYVNVEILPDNVSKKVAKGTKLIQAIYESDIHIDAVCAGMGKCGKCKVRIVSEESSELTNNEIKFLTQDEIKQNIVLACEKIITKDTIIEIINKEDSLVSSKGYIKKENMKNNPIITKVYQNLDKPSLIDHDADVNRITRQFNNTIGVDNNVIPKVHKVLKESDYNITSTLFDDKIINIQENNTLDRSYAIAIDLGTTSVGGYLIDVNKCSVINNYSYANLQKVHGADVISRINYSIESEENLDKLKDLAIKTIDIVIENMIKSSGVDKDDINLIVLLGNTTMSHLLLGVTPAGIAKSPFVPVFKETIKASVKELGIKNLNKEAKYVLLPNIGGYVGSDTLGVIISTDILNKEGNHLVIDIGTNCELGLKTNDTVLVCSTSAGPAFEGANMSCGMRAESGAIYSVDIDDDINIKTIGDKAARGVCGSGFIDITAKLLQNKIIKKQGRIIDSEKLNKELHENVRNKVVKENNINRILLGKENVYISQEDISNLQLAKGAVKAGIEILMKEAGITHLDKIYLAGAFGSNLNKESLKIIKMIPDIDSDKIEVVGNAAGSGAIDTILSKEIYENLSNLSNSIKHIELANHEEFQSRFTKGMMF